MTESRQAATVASNRLLLEETMAALGSVLVRGRRTGGPAADPRQQMRVACQLVGDAAGIALLSDIEPLAPTSDWVDAIARLSRVRMRPVNLRGRWWAQAAGPLLGFTVEGCPVALLPSRGGGYRMVHPADGDTAVTSACLAGLQPGAFMFYRPLANAASDAWQLLRFAFRGARADMTWLIAAGCAAAALAMAIPLGTNAVFDAVLSGRGFELVTLGVLLGLAACATAAFLLIRNLAVVRLEGRLQAALEPAVWDKLLTLAPSFYRGYSTGDLMSRAGGIDMMRRTVSAVTVNALLGAVFALGTLAVLFLLQPWLGVLGFAVALTASGILAVIGRHQLRYVRRFFHQIGRSFGLLYPLLLAIDKIHSSGREMAALACWSEVFVQQRRADLAALRWRAAATVAAALIQPALLVTLFTVAASQGSAMSTGTFLAAIVAIGQFALAAGQVTQALLAGMTIVPLYDRLRPILAAVPEAAARSGGSALAGQIAIDDVTFRYTPLGAPILDRARLRCEPGELIAIVGPSGAGKSTLVRLLLGFERPSAGRVSYDGRDVADLDPEHLRRQIGTVLQEARAVRGTVYENITGGLADASQECAWDAAEVAELASFIRQLPMGMQTRVSEDNRTFSGGQIQQLLLARAIAKQPAVFILDEATSALDNATQRRIFERIAGLDATRIVIAHRLSTIAKADRIYVLDRGRIAAAGTFTELLDTSGTFAALMARQVTQ